MEVKYLLIACVSFLVFCAITNINNKNVNNKIAFKNIDFIMYTKNGINKDKENFLYDV